MKYSYRTTGTCCSEIILDIENDIIKSLEFHGGCNGNLKGIAKLCEGQNIDTVSQRLEGICCGAKSTSCPDQLSRALKAIIENEQ